MTVGSQEKQFQYPEAEIHFGIKKKIMLRTEIFAALIGIVIKKQTKAPIYIPNFCRAYTFRANKFSLSPHAVEMAMFPLHSYGR
jgi:hypothetical protein